jgi:ArsR family transcriptional regulator
MDALDELFKALGDPLRLRIMRLLPAVDRCGEVCNVSELADELGVSQPNVSHHLKILKHAGVVRCRKMCRDVYYWIDREALERAFEELTTKIVAAQGKRTRQ